MKLYQSFLELEIGKSWVDVYDIRYVRMQKQREYALVAEEFN